MTAEEITKMLQQVRSGKLRVQDAVERLRHLPYEDLGYAKIDHHRALRQGFPEVIFARGKTPYEVETALRSAHSRLRFRLMRRKCQRGKYLILLAGAPGFEPGNGGIKIRCLTTWLRPNRYRRAAAKRFHVRRPDHSGAALPDQCPRAAYYICGAR